jgi:predicted transcriptional regulator of viral defense system
LVIANRLYAPSYISLEFALAYYHLIPEAIYTVTSVTTRPTRTIVAAGTTFAYHHLKSSAFTGYAPVPLGAETALIATPEKAVVDYLYFAQLRRVPLNDRLSLRTLSWARLEAASRVMGRPSLVERIRSLR